MRENGTVIYTRAFERSNAPVPLILTFSPRRRDPRIDRRLNASELGLDSVARHFPSAFPFSREKSWTG